MYFLNQTSFEVSTKQGPGFDVMFDNAESLSKLLTLSQVSQLGIKVFGKPFKSGTAKTTACQSIVEHIKKGGAPEEKSGANKAPEQFSESNRASMGKAGEGTKDATKAPKKPVKSSKKSQSVKSSKKSQSVKSSKKSQSKSTGKKEKAVKPSEKPPKKKPTQMSSKGPQKQTVSKKKLDEMTKKPVNNHAWAFVEALARNSHMKTHKQAPKKKLDEMTKKPVKKAQEQISKAQEPGKRGRKTPIYTLTIGKDLPDRFKTPENKKNILVNNHAWALVEAIEQIVNAATEQEPDVTEITATAELIVEQAKKTRLFKVHGTNETAKRLMTRWHKLLKSCGWINP